MKCNDCGTVITEENQSRPVRSDICDGCWDNREKLVENMGQIEPAFFRQIQKEMAYGRGTAKKLIEEFLP